MYAPLTLQKIPLDTSPSRAHPSANNTWGLFISAFLLMCALSLLSMGSIAQTTPSMSAEHISHFCTDKPIWGAFGIEPASCTNAATTCAHQTEFLSIDPVVLNEAFYNCVFTQLGIDVE